MKNKFLSRKFLMSLAGQITGLLVVFFPQHAGEIETLVTNITGASIAVLSLLGYLAAEASIDKETIKSAKDKAALFILVGVLALSAGCSLTPGQQFTRSASAYSSANEEVVRQSQLGNMTEGQLEKAVDASDLALEALKDAREALSEGKTGPMSPFSRALSRLDDFINKMVLSYIEDESSEKESDDASESTTGYFIGDYFYRQGSSISSGCGFSRAA